VAGLLIALLTAGVLLVVGPTETTDADAVTAAELQVLLDDWARAVREGDERVLGTLVDATAPGLFESERRRLAALSAVPLADFGYELGPGPELPVPADLAARYGTAPVRAHRVYLRYAIDGVDERPTRRPVTVLFVHRPEGWRIADDDPDLPDAGTWRGPWDHGPLHLAAAQTAGGRSLVLGHPDEADLVDAIAAELPAAVEAVSEAWGDDWPRRALVVVTGSRDEFTHLVGTRHDGDEIAAVAVSDAVDPERGTATGQRIVFSPAASSRLDADSLRAVLGHEMVHVATRARTVDGSPMWILEGYADLLGRGTADLLGRGTDVTVTPDELRRTAPTLTARIRAEGAPDRLPADPEFAAVDSVLAYETAWSLAAHIADVDGLDRLTTLYRRLATGPVSDDEFDRALTEVLGIGTGEFVDRWGRWLTERI